ncbi:glutathione S-transferase [Pseudooceanicola sediminis]|uniref:Glutathione S-transferase n=1 Tax=Pseudooceanicola sediminis TaxID=2211117 RepID=A0A399J5V4_9RHOB|nr:glutathione S-transferase [Pseudooceanicola sediminis]KAA2314174.1 glutathione S-transferase [Puniceibacterium sp. HSS470]RII39967.1 glutathione S-transferase [Pseudooceanicola sediminis]|tara:strand:- start:23156 stop:24028 length:873 start_codon:yes stop_codon:yes gene_type:complete
MTYDLFIGDRSFSSWSLRGWLMFEQFGLPVKTHLLDLYGDNFARDLAALSPARLVPAMRTPDGDIIGETLAMAEMLAERHPDANMWPNTPSARTMARWMAAEMHAGFVDLRSACPMQLLHQYQEFAVTPAVQRDLDRIALLFKEAQARRVEEGPWLFGRYSIADAFYAPVAARIAGYGLTVDGPVKAYVDTTLNDPAFRRWRALGLTRSYDPVPYALDLPTARWPGPSPLPAKAVEVGTPINQFCPFSGKPVAHLAEVAGQTLGFCNPTCRDKTVNDAEAWPAVMALLQP